MCIRQLSLVSIVVLSQFLTTGVQAQILTVVNGGFEGAAFDDWFNRTNYCYLRGATGNNLPPNPQGTNWVEFGNASWVYQQIGTWTGGLPLDVSLSVGSVAGRAFPGLYVSLWVGGDPGAAADGGANNPTTLESSVGATQIAISDLIQPEELTGGDAQVSEQQVTFNTGSGYTEGDPLWLLIQSAGPQRILIGNVSVAIPSGDPKAIAPVPEVGLQYIGLNDTLTWTAINTTNPTFTINIGTTEACDDILFDESLGNIMVYTPPAGLLDYETVYYWRVDVIENSNVYPGTVWNFTTEPYAYHLTELTAMASNGQDPNGAHYTIDGSGLDENDLHDANSFAMWLSEEDPNGAWIQYDFDKPYQLFELLVWNYNGEFEHVVGNGAKDVLIQYSLDGLDWMDLGVEVFDQAPGNRELVEAQVIDMSLVVAKSVRLLITSNHSTINQKQYGLSEVRFYYVPVRAREPKPQNSAMGVPADASLVWRRGRDAVLHEVYVGSDPNALTLEGTVSESTFDTFDLDLPLGQTIYWRVDERTSTESPVILSGDVWTYTIEETSVIDDFETYTDTWGNIIFQSWIDGIGWKDAEGNTGAGNDSGALVGYWPPPTTELIVARDNQAMPLSYNNANGVGNSITTRTFAGVQNWTRSGVQGLVLSFYGDPGNSLDQFYIKVNDLRVDYPGEAADIQRISWQKWYIPLSELSGTDLTQVKSMSIGLEGNGSGVVYIDDILLTPEARQQVTPVEPSADNLISHWAFEGDASDSTGNNPGTVLGLASFGEGKVGQALVLPGLEPDYVELTGYKGILGASAITVTGWVNLTSESAGGTILGWGHNLNPGARFGFRVDAGRLRFEHNAGNVQGDAQLQTNGWHHVAVVIQANAEISYPQVALYVDGRDDTRPTIDPDGSLFALEAGEDARIGSRPVLNDRFFNGAIDELYLYDRALTPEEIAGAAGRSMAFDQ